MVIVILLLSTLTSFSNQGIVFIDCDEVGRYLKLNFFFAEDTLILDESVELNIVFENITEDTVQFYPQGVLRLSKPFVSFGIESIYPINDTLDVSNKVRLFPYETYKAKYTISTKSSFFNIGKNELTLIYECKELTGELRMYNTLCGKLESDKTVVFLVNK